MSSVEIHRFELRYRTPVALRSRLDDLAVRQLPAALEQALEPLDDGRIIALRRVETKVQLGRRLDAAFVTAWAAAIAQSVARALQRVRPDPQGDVAAFPDALTALGSYVCDALAQRLDAWWWQSGGVLQLVRHALAALPGGGRFLAPPPPLYAAVESHVFWAMQLAGPVLPQLIHLLQRADVPALHTLSHAQAEALLLQLDLPIAATEHGSAAWTPIAPPFGSVAMVSGDAADPRNLLLLASDVLSRQPALRGLPGLRDTLQRLVTQHVADVDVRGPLKRSLPPATEVRFEPPHMDSTPQPLADMAMTAKGGAVTLFGGLLFLLHPMQRLQVAAALLQEPPLAELPGFAAVWYVMCCILVPEALADPAALWTAGMESPQVPVAPLDQEGVTALSRVAAQVWARAEELRCSVLATDEAYLRQQLLRLPLQIPDWLGAFCLGLARCVTGYLRTHVQQMESSNTSALLRQICDRRGRLVQTRTHVDLYLPLDSADVAIRRAGLDINPGWVPALGRIVSIHYE